MHLEGKDGTMVDDELVCGISGLWTGRLESRGEFVGAGRKDEGSGLFAGGDALTAARQRRAVALEISGVGVSSRKDCGGVGRHHNQPFHRIALHRP